MKAGSPLRRAAEGLAGVAALVAGLPLDAAAQVSSLTGVPAGLPPAAQILTGPQGPFEEAAPSYQQPQNQVPLPGFGPPVGTQPAGPPSPELTIVPSISLGEEYTDNVYQSSQKRWDLITVLSPQIFIQDNRPRITANFAYAPSLNIYARTPGANYFGQNLSGDATAEIVPDTFYVTARALAAVVPTSGGLGGLTGFNGISPIGIPTSLGSGVAPSTSVLPYNNRTQDFGFSVTPYVVHAFGTFGTAKAGLSLNQASQFVATNQVNPIPGTSNVQSQHSVTGEATAQFQTGEDFGRVRNLVIVDAQRSSGTGVLSGAQSNIVTDWFGYALNRFIIPFGELGYENITYNTVPKTKIDDTIWQAGVQLTPNANSLISIGYGRNEGVTGFNVHGYYAVTARSTVSIDYSTQISSDLTTIQGTLGLTSFDPHGAPVNSLTGAPLFLGGGLLAVQNGLYQSHYLTITESTTLDRDQFGISFQHQSQTPIANAPGASSFVFAQSGSSIFGNWVHDISERTRLTSSIGYTRTSYQTAPSGNESLFGASVLVSRALSRTVSANAQYVFFDQTSNFPGRTFTMNIVLVSLTKTF